jgi:hypothetical protein
VRYAALQDPELAALRLRDPNYRVALEQLSVARPFPFTPVLFAMQREQLQPRLDRPVLGLQSTAEALDEAAAGAARLLLQYKSSCDGAPQ